MLLVCVVSIAPVSPVHIPRPDNDKLVSLAKCVNALVPDVSVRVVCEQHFTQIVLVAGGNEKWMQAQLWLIRYDVFDVFAMPWPNNCTTSLSTFDDNTSIRWPNYFNSNVSVRHVDYIWFGRVYFRHSYDAIRYFAVNVIGRKCIHFIRSLENNCLLKKGWCMVYWLPFNAG